VVVGLLPVVIFGGNGSFVGVSLLSFKPRAFVVSVLTTLVMTSQKLAQEFAFIQLSSTRGGTCFSECLQKF
jgi:hypothetical protein